MTTDAPPRVGNPYVGPTSFRLGDPLYGRDREEEDLLDLLIAERIVLLYSPSGAGKTSLIQAALVPALQEAGFEVLPVIRVTHALEPRPGMPTPRNRYVLGTLLSLEEGVPPDRQRPVEELATLTLRQYMEAYADRDRRPGNEVLVFDQFEEVLTADPTDEAAKHQFFAELGEMLRDRGHWALFSMREDFLAALDPYLRHVPTRFRTTFRLDLLAVPEALDAIRLPARTAGVDFTEEAANQLVDDLRRVRVQRPSGDTEDAYGAYVEPVQLQVACRLLWSTLPPGADRITRADVEALGDVDRALGDYYADRVRTIAAETGVRESVIRDWFEDRLITPQGLRGEVLEGPEVPGQAGRTLLGRLVDAHLVRAESRRQATWYELAHDRLIEPVRRDNTAWRAQHMTSFERAARLWAEEGRPDRLLLLGTDLAAAESDAAVLAGALKAREHDFLEASRRADEQQRREARSAAMLRRSTRRLWVAVALVTLLALTAGFFLVRSRDAEGKAKNQETVTRMIVGIQQNLGRDQPLAVALAGSLADKYGTAQLSDQAREVLYLAAESPVSLVLRGHRGRAVSGVISGDGTDVAVAGLHDVQIWGRQKGDRRAHLALRSGEVINAMDISRDGQTVAVGLTNGTLLAWHVKSGTPQRWKEGTGEVWWVSVSPDGTRVASVGAGNRAALWSIDGRLERELQPTSSALPGPVAFSQDGREVVGDGGAMDAVVWDVESGAQIHRVPLPAPASQLLIGPNDTELASITATAVSVWDVASGNLLRSYTASASASQGSFLNVNVDLSQALEVDSYGTVTTYDLATGNSLASVSVPGAAPWGAGFDYRDSGDVFVLGNAIDPSFWRLTPTNSYKYVKAAAVKGSRVVGAWSDGVIRVWDRDAPRGLGRVMTRTDMSGDDVVYRLAVDGNGDRVAAATSDGRVRVWDAGTGALLATLEQLDPVTQAPNTSAFWYADLTPDGTGIVAGGASGGVGLWDAGSGTELREILPPQRLGLSQLGLSQIVVSPDGSNALVAFYFPPNGGATDEESARSPEALLAPLSGKGKPVPLRLPGARDAARGTGPSEYVTAAAFDRDGTTVDVGTSTGRVVAFDVRSGRAVWHAVAHHGFVRSIVVDDHTGTLLTTGSDNRVALLDPARHARSRQIASSSSLMAALLTSDGKGVAQFSGDGGLGHVPLEDRKLMDLVRSKVLRSPSHDDCEFYGLSSSC